jgi:hypothetical protein
VNGTQRRESWDIVRTGTREAVAAASRVVVGVR